MSLLLGLVVAAAFGSGDFLGGLASRRASTLAVLVVVQLCALAGAAVVATVAGGDPTGTDLGLGALAGALNVVALGCLYRGLAIGQIGAVAPVAAVVAAIIPVGWGLATGERPSALALVGVGLAIVAGGLLGRDRDERPSQHSSRALLLAVGAGVGFGLSFVCYAATAEDSRFWPVLTARVAAVAVVVAALLITRTPLVLPRASRGQAVGAGLLDVSAATLQLVAVRAGLAATVAPVAALAPGFTVFHAHWYLHERASRAQLVGLVVALVGLVLIATG